MSAQGQVIMTGYHLRNTTSGHFKFYTVLIGEEGTVILHWGRIGTAGQTKVQMLSPEDGEALGMRQVFSKLSSGYTKEADGIKFSMPYQELVDAIRHNQLIKVFRHFNSAMSLGDLAGQREAVLRHYDDFVEKARKLMNETSTRSFGEVMDEFEQLEQAWTTINDKHAEADVIMSLTKQMLGQRMVQGGS